MGSQIHRFVIKMGLESDKCIVSALIDMYEKCGCNSQMSQVFDEVDALHIGACSTLVSGLQRKSFLDEALRVFSAKLRAPKDGLAQLRGYRGTYKLQ